MKTLLIPSLPFRRVAFAALLVLPTLATHTNAQTLTNDMTCSQAQREFERRGRVLTRTRNGTILPIYGGVPLNERWRLSCDPFSGFSNTTVITRDRRSCPISTRCN